MISTVRAIGSVYATGDSCEVGFEHGPHSGFIALMMTRAEMTLLLDKLAEALGMEAVEVKEET